MRRAAWRLLACAALLACARTAAAQRSGGAVAPQQISGFRVPSYDDENNMTSQMFGDTAVILPDGKVDITELRMEFYSGSGSNRQTAMRVNSPRCIYNRNSGNATSAAPVRLSRENMVVTGTGFNWNGKDQRLVILQDARVVLKEAKRSMKDVVQP